MTGPCKCPLCNAVDICDRCAEPVPDGNLYEISKNVHKWEFVCQSCFEDIVDRAEAEREGDR